MNQTPGRGRRLRLALPALALSWALALSGMTAVAVAVYERAEPPPQPSAALADPQWMPPDAAPAGVSTSLSDAQSPAPAPLRIKVPRIGVDASLEQLGLNQDGTVGVPFVPSEAGWYKWSSQPGDPGPAVILGHVDAPDIGAAVFYRLGSLRYGDHISVQRADGTTARFLVTAVAEFQKSDFPTAAVYGPTSTPALRLITCGDWDAATHSYLGNTVVFADLISPTATPTPTAGTDSSNSRSDSTTPDPDDQADTPT